MASAALEGYVNRLVSVITADGRNFVGTLKGMAIPVVEFSMEGYKIGKIFWLKINYTMDRQ